MQEKEFQYAHADLSVTSLLSAILCCASSLWALVSSFGCNLVPKFFMRDAATFSESLSRGLQNRLESFGVPHQKPFEVVLPFGLKQYCDGFAVLRHDDRPILAGLEIVGKIRSDLLLSCNFHSSTSSPAIKSRLPSFTPMAWIWTCRCSSSMP